MNREGHFLLKSSTAREQEGRAGLPVMRIDFQQAKNGNIVRAQARNWRHFLEKRGNLLKQDTQ